MRNTRSRSYLVTLLALYWRSCLGHQEDRCEVAASLVVVGSYRPVGRCSSGHIQEALHIGESCAPRDTILRLPWPQNSSQIDQVGKASNSSGTYKLQYLRWCTGFKSSSFTCRIFQ